MRFLKENSYDVIRLYINQIGITIFSLVLYFSVTSLSENPDNASLYAKVKLGISVFAIIFYFALLYTASWDWGANDKIRIESGKITKRIGKGALIATIAQLPNFILAGGCVISELIIKNGEGVISQIFRPIYLLTNGMYIGLIQIIFSSSANVYLFESIGYFVTPFLAIAATHIGYIFGVKNIKIFPSKKHRKK